MPETVKSLKVENDALKTQVNHLKEDLKSFQDTMLKKIQVLSNNKATPSQSELPSNVEMAKSIDYLSNEYDDFNRFRAFAEKEFNRFNKRLEELTSNANEVANAIDEIQKYSYQYNLKILGVPELSQGKESASDTASLCIRLFRKMGVTAESHDIDIAHRVPKRNVSDGPRPIICKCVRRLVRSEVIAARKEASKVSLEDIGLPPNSIQLKYDPKSCFNRRASHTEVSGSTRRSEEISEATWF
jgi:hypothetical protein